jgi:hypothetical protein
VLHRPGQDNNVADVLSSLSRTTDVDVSDKIDLDCFLTEAFLTHATTTVQLSDDFVHALKRNYETDTRATAIIDALKRDQKTSLPYRLSEGIITTSDTLFTFLEQWQKTFPLSCRTSVITRVLTVPLEQ